MKTWQEAKAAFPRLGVPADEIMETVQTSNGLPVFKFGRKKWVVNLDNPFAKLGIALSVGFSGENGGGQTHQQVAMFALAADTDKAKLTSGQIEVLTAGYEHDSTEWWRQQELGAKFPNIQQAILSFF